MVRNSASGFGRSMRWGVQDRKGVRGTAAAAPGSRIDGEWFCEANFRWGSWLWIERGWVFGRFGAPGIEDPSIVAFFWCPVALRVACLTYFLLDRPTEKWTYALRLGVQFLAKDTGNYAPVNIFVYFSHNSSTKDLLSCLVIQLCKLRSNVSHG